MSTTSPIEVAGDGLRVVATPSKRARTEIYVYASSDPEIPIAVAEVKLTDDASREALVAKLPEEHRANAEPLLRRIAAEVGLSRTRGSSGEGDGPGAGGDVVFEPLDPWPDPVDGAQLLDDVTGLIQRFVVLGEPARDATALWIVQAYAHGASDVSPILMISSPLKRCGKTTLGSIVGKLAPRALPSCNATSAVIYRAVESHAPTLIVDEADTFLARGSDMRGILNSGHYRANAYVLRNGAGGQPRRFSTWAPKVVIGIGVTQLASTLVDRSVIVELRRRTDAERVEPLRLDDLEGLCLPLRRRALRWVTDHMNEIREAPVEEVATLNDRARDNWRVMLSIASIAGGRWRHRARQAAVAVSGGEVERSDDSIGVRLLTDIRELFGTAGVTRVPTKELLEWLAKREGWGRYQGGKAITATALAKLLSLFSIAPRAFRTADGVVRGYDSSQFLDAFARYLPSDPQQPQQTLQVMKSTTYEAA